MYAEICVGMNLELNLLPEISESFFKGHICLGKKICYHSSAPILLEGCYYLYCNTVSV